MHLKLEIPDCMVAIDSNCCCEAHAKLHATPPSFCPTGLATIKCTRSVLPISCLSRNPTGAHVHGRYVLLLKCGMRVPKDANYMRIKQVRSKTRC